MTSYLENLKDPTWKSSWFIYNNTFLNIEWIKAAKVRWDDVGFGSIGSKTKGPTRPIYLKPIYGIDLAHLWTLLSATPFHFKAETRSQTEKELWRCHNRGIACLLLSQNRLHFFLYFSLVKDWNFIRPF